MIINNKEQNCTPYDISNLSEVEIKNIITNIFDTIIKNKKATIQITLSSSSTNDSYLNN